MALKPIIAASTPAESTPSESPSGNGSPSAAASTPASTTPLQKQNMDEKNSELPRQVVLPPRAKPGRKPSTDMPANKRKAQNREAQRNFRERKKLKEEESLEVVRKRDRDHLAVIKQMQDQHETEIKLLRDRMSAAQQSELDRFKTQLAEQSSSLQTQQKRNDELYEQLQALLRRQNADAASRPRASAADQSAVPLPPKRRRKRSEENAKPISSGRPSLHSNSGRPGLDAMAMGSSPPTPPAEEPMEIDFTHLGKAPVAPNTSLDGADEWCGFCQTNTYCACRDNVINSEAAVRTESFKKPSTLEPSAAPVGPGSCKACLDDPERRRICLKMAQKGQDEEFGQGDLPTPGLSAPQSYPGDYRDNSLRENGHTSHMTCTDAITYGRTHDPNFHENWNNDNFIRKLRISQHPEQRQGDALAGQEVEIASIMAAMSTSTPAPQHSNHGRR